MELLGSGAVSAAVLACTAGLMLLHARQWRAAQRANLETAELDYRRGQFRRRAQITVLFGLAAAALPFVVPIFGLSLRGGTAYLAVVILICLWALGLALIDILAIKLYFGRLQHQNRVEQLRLEAEMRRLRAPRRNGQAERPGPRDGRTATGPNSEAGS